MILATKKKAVSRNTPLPYAFGYFNVSPFFALSSCKTKPIKAKLFNQFMEGINSEPWHLPKAILFIIDKDMIDDISFQGFRCKILFKNAIDWLSLRVHNEIETRYDDLLGKKPGAVRKTPTKLVWVGMTQRPYIKMTNKGFVFAQCNTFNSVMANVVARYPNTHVLSIQFPNDPSLFDATGNFSATGRILLWREVEHGLKEIDTKNETNATALWDGHQPKMSNKSVSRHDKQENRPRIPPNSSYGDRTTMHSSSRRENDSNLLREQDFHRMSLENAYHDFDVENY